MRKPTWHLGGQVRSQVVSWRMGLGKLLQFGRLPARRAQYGGGAEGSTFGVEPICKALTRSCGAIAARVMSIAPAPSSPSRQPVEPDQMATHLKGDNRDGQDAADPESPSHVDELGTWSLVEGDEFRLQRHATDGAASGADLTDLRCMGLV